MSTQVAEEIKSVFEQFKVKNDEVQADIKKFGETTQENKNTLDRMQDQIDALETKLNRPLVRADEEKRDLGAENDTFTKYLRKGVQALEADEMKSLSTDSDPDGGYLVPPERRNEILRKLIEFSPIRQLANVMTISRNAYEIPAESATDFAAGWVAERGARTATTTAQLRLERIPAHEIYAKPLATQTMLDDSTVNVEEWITERVATRFAVMEGAAFVSGDGMGKPESLLIKSGVTEVVSGHASQITADGLIHLFYHLPEFYTRNATWVMKRSTIREIRKLKDNQNQYLWQPGLAGLAPATILDKPYVEAIDMPEIASNAYPIVFGDIRAAYTIVDRQGIRILRDPYSSKPYVEFYTTMRVGGQVILAEALRKLRIST